MEGLVSGDAIEPNGKGPGASQFRKLSEDIEPNILKDIINASFVSCDSTQEISQWSFIEPNYFFKCCLISGLAPENKRLFI